MMKIVDGELVLDEKKISVEEYISKRPNLTSNSVRELRRRNIGNKMTISEFDRQLKQIQR